MPYGIRRKSIRDPMNNVERRQVELKKELDDLMVEITEEAISVRIDYETSGSNMDSGSIVAIHQNSPLLDNEKEEFTMGRVYCAFQTFSVGPIFIIFSKLTRARKF